MPAATGWTRRRRPGRAWQPAVTQRDVFERPWPSENNKIIVNSRVGGASPGQMLREDKIFAAGALYASAVAGYIQVLWTIKPTVRVRRKLP
jgi:hypothetical protein